MGGGERGREGELNQPSTHLPTPLPGPCLLGNTNKVRGRGEMGGEIGGIAGVMRWKEGVGSLIRPIYTLSPPPPPLSTRRGGLGWPGEGRERWFRCSPQPRCWQVREGGKMRAGRNGGKVGVWKTECLDGNRRGMGRCHGMPNCSPRDAILRELFPVFPSYPLP